MVHNDGKGRQRVEVDHRSEWRFLWHHGSFTTSLLVEQVGQMLRSSDAPIVCSCVASAILQPPHTTAL